jgi:hypothetical protein
VLLTHGHNDHVGDALAMLKKTDAMLVANYEIGNYLAGQGANGNKVNPGLHGGTVDCGGFTTAFVNALHSSSYGMKDGQNVYLGNPTGKTLDRMGDTDIFGDMALIEELHKPDIGIVPIGDRLTMGGAVATLAYRRFSTSTKRSLATMGASPSSIRSARQSLSSAIYAPSGHRPSFYQSAQGGRAQAHCCASAPVSSNGPNGSAAGPRRGGTVSPRFAPRIHNASPFVQTRGSLGLSRQTIAHGPANIVG